MDADVVRDSTDHLEHGGLAMAGAEERKHIDRAVDGPFDIVVDQGFQIFMLAFVDRAMQCARETPETMLCHNFNSSQTGFFRQRPALVDVISDAVPETLIKGRIVAALKFHV